MKIERIDYYNLDRSVQRNNDFLENLRNLEVDMSIVHRYSAHDIRDFSGVADFHAAAKRDHPNFKFSDALGKKIWHARIYVVDSIRSRYCQRKRSNFNGLSR